MTLSTSRQQFLAYESQAAEDIQYSRRGGVLISTCVCVGLVIIAVLVAVLVGVIVYFITYFKLSQKPGDFWDETEPFGQTGPPSPNLRLPPDVVPSFYRLKLNADLDSSNYTGEVYITIRASKKVKEIVLHSKGLSISNNAKLTEQIYEKVETLHMRRKRENLETAEIEENNVTVIEKKTNLSEIQPNVASQDEAVLLNQTALPSVEQSEIAVQNNSQNILDAAQDSSRSINEGLQNNSSNVVDTVQDVSNNVPESTRKSADSEQNGNAAVNTHIINSNTQVTHSSVRNIKILSITEAAGDCLVLTLATTLKPNVDYILEIPFEGKISNSLTGFYKSTYTNANKEEKSLAVTQFEPTSARAAFPCFDEPGFKAKFEISIAHRKNLTVLSNMNIAATEPFLNQPDWEWTHFERSVSMSTYLVAYIICDFKSVDTSYVSKDNITKPIRIWTRPELLSKAEYAAAITPKLLEFYEDVFGVPYALDKLDLVAIPDFSSGAMENWGLITFRETTLLFDEANSVPRDKQNVAIDVAHELAHQWFGNLVTMQWWTDLWLNEGFATYIEYVGVDRIEPKWNMFESFTRDMMDLLRSDALKNTSPVSRQVVEASEISQKFDEISYTKGANLIRMLNNTMSEESFHKGLVLYLNQWKYANAEENDLWEAMSRVVSSDPGFAGRSLVRVMNSWTRQAGYPLLQVSRDYGTGSVHFSQKLFTASKEPYKNMQDQLWQIPINYVTVDTPTTEWTTKPKLWLDDRSTTAQLDVNASQALYVNVGATGYYRVNYDQRNWELLSSALHSHLVPPITAAQLIDDAFNLAKTNHLDYSYALGLTTCVINGEDSKIVWDLLLNNMAFLKHNLRTTSGYVHFQDYMKILLHKQLERLNYGLDQPKNDNEAFLIENLLTWECMMESPRCLDWAKSEFNKWTEQSDLENNPIPSYLRGLVYSTVLRHGGRAEFDRLWRAFLSSTDPNVKSLLINSLPSTRVESLITMMLEKSLTEIPKQYAVAVWNLEPPLGTSIAQRFLIDNFSRVYNTFTEMDSFMFPAVLTGAFGFISTQDELDKLKRFAVAHKPQLRAMSQTLQKLVDTAALRLRWVTSHAPAVQRWLSGYLVDANNSTKSNESLPPAERVPPQNISVPRSNEPVVAPPQNNTETLSDVPKVAAEEPKEQLQEPKETQEKPTSPQQNEEVHLNSDSNTNNTVQNDHL